MIGLPAKFRIKVYNGTGQTIAAHDITVKVCFQKIDVDATIVESASVTLFDSAATLATAGYEAGAWYDNTTSKWLGLHGLCYSNTTGSPNGTIRVFLENTTDPTGTTTSPSDGRGWMLVEIAHTAAGSTTRPLRV